MDLETSFFTLCTKFLNFKSDADSKHFSISELNELIYQISFFFVPNRNLNFEFLFNNFENVNNNPNTYVFLEKKSFYKKIPEKNKHVERSSNETKNKVIK